MTDKEIEEARELFEWKGKVDATQENHEKRISRGEKGALGLLSAAAYLWAKSAGLVP